MLLLCTILILSQFVDQIVVLIPEVLADVVFRLSATAHTVPCLSRHIRTSHRIVLGVALVSDRLSL